MRVRKLFLSLIVAVLVGFAIHSAAWAAACTCTYSTSTSTTSTVRGVWVNCATSNSAACTLTDAAYNNGVSFAKHLELNNDCSHAVTVATAGQVAVASKGDVLGVGVHKVYDVMNGNCANTPPTASQGGCSNVIPHGTFSIINASAADSGCFNVLELW